MNRTLSTALILCFLAAPVSAAEPAPSLGALDKVPDMVDAATVVPDLGVELKYSTTDNFIGQDVYGDLEKCYLQKEAAQMLQKASAALTTMRPDLKLLTYDCVRPVSVQKIMWKVVKGTPQQNYVANPNTKTGSIHNYGCAVDLTLAAKESGKPLDLGTPFDFFGKAAQPRHEFTLLRQGKLSQEQWANRLLLREVMVRAGFIPIASEWWHFNCAPNHVARKKFQKVP